RQTDASFAVEPSPYGRTHSAEGVRKQAEQVRPTLLAVDSALPRRQYPCHARGLAIEVGRGLQPVLVGIPGEHELPALETIDHHARHFRAHRRAALAAADAALGGDPGGIHIVRRMDDNRALTGTVVHPGFEPVHAQRVAVLAAVALGRAKQADARLV